MEIKPLKTVRFSKLLEESGKPVPVTLWTAPEEDRDFAIAMNEDRVLTVVQRNLAAGADYGLVGFFKKPLATYLVFPKKLQHPAETKVVGIKYEELAEEKPRGPVHKPKPEKVPVIRTHKVVVTAQSPEKPAKREDTKPRHAQPEPEPPKPKAPPPPPPEPKLHRFRSNVELTFHQVIPIEVEATTAMEAAQLVKEKMEQLQPDLAAATIKKRASAPKKV